MTGLRYKTRKASRASARDLVQSKKAPHEYEARPLAFYGKTVTLEGPEVDGATIIEFKNIEEAKATYDNPVYQEALKHRLKGAKYRVFVIEGLPGGDLNG